MRWPWFRHSNSQKGRIGIAVTLTGELAAVAVAGGRVVARLQMPKTDWSKLGEWVQQLGWRRAKASLVLTGNCYQLQMLAAADVDDNELADAMRFRLGELTTIPLEQLLVQAFRLPVEAYRGRQKMAFVAFCERAMVQDMVVSCRQQQIRIESIVITEMSVLALLGDLDPETSIAVLKLDDSSGKMMIYDQGALFLRRDFTIGLSNIAPELSVASGNSTALSASASFNLSAGRHAEQLDNLGLEIQRSLDYFESQQGMGSVGQLWLLDTDRAGILSPLMEQLELRVNIPCRRFSLSNWLGDEENASNSTIVLALGAALTPGQTLVHQDLEVMS
ncbi:hypothetical protein [Oceanobacter mangrovi]|uniref:hypothetical protein n=1 Tax=Oceanobacter mangrovi TaxID=2862510 RepID=UPI001C8D70F5|nr:hypothetical protein [Oceanobacter mangrovi]